MRSEKKQPVIGITMDVSQDEWTVSSIHSELIWNANGIPILLPPITSLIPDFLSLCDGLVLTGGDDPDTTEWGVPVHPKAKLIHPDRQRFELEVLRALNDQPDVPVLGICLGMQLMGLHAGGTLNQFLPDTHSTADLHWDHGTHTIESEFGAGEVHSHHRQALSDPGSLRIIATAPDGIIEGVRDRNRNFYVGVQWHPERTDDPALGSGIMSQLVRASAKARTDRARPAHRQGRASVAVSQ